MKMKRKDFLVTAAGAAATVAASAAAFAQTRGEVGSARNLQDVRARLEALIDQLQHDQHDYGGFRVRAIGAMAQARQDLDAALRWDATHGY